MSRNILLPTLLAALFCVVGCSEQEPEMPANGDDGETVFQPQIDTLDKARDVKNMLQESGEEQKKRLDNP